MEDPIASGPHPKTSTQAIWSLILGILSIACLWLLGSIPAIILGILAIKNIDRSPGTLQGRGLAIAGIATGAAGVLMGTLSVAIMMPAMVRMSSKAEEVKYLHNARQVATACHAYASDNNHTFPPNLEVLATDGYIDDANLLEVLDSDTGEMGKFQIQPGVSFASTTPLAPLITSPPIAGKKRIVVFFDGFAKVVSEAEFQELMSKNSDEPR